MTTAPEPRKRREFREPVKAEIRERSGGVCECSRMPADIAHMFPKHCDRPAVDIDHIYADTLEADKSADLTAEDGAHLSKACHLLKSANDQAMRKKRNAHRVRDDRPQKPKTVTRRPWPKGRKINGGGFQKSKPQRSATRPLERREKP